MKLKVAIMGAGITGAYLYRLLDRGGQKTDIFNKKPGTSCGINPCGWGTSHEFTELVSASGLNSSLYILASSDYVFMHGFKIRANLMTIDKPRLIRDLLQGAEVSYSQPNPGEYDRVIDATGVARVFLPPIENDIVVRCTQFKIKTDAPRSNETSLGRIGYAWCFPLANNTYHIGCGSLSYDPLKILKELAWMCNVPPRDILCSCGGTIRLTGPEHSQPFFVASDGHEIWGVGESIGCVPPLVGDGIVSGMKSVQILLDHWNDPSGYARDIIKEFRWMSRERKVVDKLRRNKNLRLRDAWALRKNAGRMGIGVGLKDAAVLLKHLQ
jgi:flavin-dependent dehydrogenase